MIEEVIKNVEGQKSVKICQMTSEMVEGVSRIHMQAFKGAMSTRLGISYIKKFLGWFVEIEEGIALVAFLKNGKKEQIVGYVIGVPPNCGMTLNRDLFWVASWNACIRPWLFCSAQFRATLKARITGFFTRSSGQELQLDLPIPVMSLVGLAVRPNLQGQNIGKELLCAFESRARDFRVRSLKLSVYPENSAARRVYEKCGWVALEDSIIPGKAMYYYKII